MSDFDNFKEDLAYMIQTMYDHGNQPRPKELTMMVSPALKKQIEKAEMVDKKGYVGVYEGIPVKLGKYEPLKKKHWWRRS